MTTEAVDSKNLDQHECKVCGYVYEPEKGDDKGQVSPGTSFEELPANWRCPICNAPRSSFQNVGPRDRPSGFQENLGYGLGVNTMTPAQKNLLIFGALALAFLFMISLYGLG
jgi:rubredoxin